MIHLERKKLPDGVEAKARVIQLKADAIASDGTIEGYGSIFGNVDGGGDIVLPGAFSASLTKPGRMKVAMLHEHDSRYPLGIWDELREDNRGLKVKGRILDTEKGVDTLKLLRAGMEYGLSIGYQCKRHEVDETVKDEWGWPIRKIIEADLWEVSLVVFPMNDAARVESVKNADTRTVVSLAPLAAELKRILRPADPLAALRASLARL